MIRESFYNNIIRGIEIESDIAHISGQVKVSNRDTPIFEISIDRELKNMSLDDINKFQYLINNLVDKLKTLKVYE